MNGFDLNSKTLERRKGYITYLKEAEKITEFLNIIGAHNALLRFEDIRIVRDMRNSVNRLVNCETANLNKTIGAALRQIENIRYIDETVGLDILPDKLREIAQLRRDYQDVTLKELGEMVSGGKISKSGINHRLRKIDDIAEKLRAGETVAKNKRLKGKWSCGSKKSSGFIKKRFTSTSGCVVCTRGQSLSCRYFHRKRWEDSKCKEHNGDYELSNWNW